MNFISRRYLLCLCASFMFPMFIISVVPDNIRLICVITALFLLMILLTVLFFLSYKRNGRKTCISVLIAVCAFVSVFATVYPLYLFNYKDKPYLKYAGQISQITATVTDIYFINSGYVTFLVNVSSVNQEKADFGVVVYSEGSFDIHENDIICAEVFLSTDFAYEYSDYYLKQRRILFEGEIIEGGAFEVIGRNSNIFTRFELLSQRMERIFDFKLKPAVAEFAKAILLGKDDSIALIFNRNFRRIGLSHIIALSGSHLAVITGFAALFLKPVFKNRRLADFIEIWFVVFYLLLTGFPSSLLRAGIMLIICKIGRISRRASDSMTALFLTVTLILLTNPYAVLDFGLILSFCATFGIILLYPYLSEIKNEYFGRHYIPYPIQIVLSFVYDGICLSFCACVFANIATVLMFDSFSLIGIISTFVLSVPIIVFMLLSFLILIFNKVPSVCSVLSDITEKLYSCIDGICAHMAEPEFVAVSSHRADFIVPFVFLACFFIIFVIFNFSKSGFIVAAIAVQLSLFPITLLSNIADADRYTYKYIQNENSDAFILSHGNDTVLVDISSGDSKCAAKNLYGVYSSGRTDIDILLFSHVHYRHADMLEKINANMPVRKIMLPVSLTESERGYSLDIEACAEKYGITVEYFSCFGDSFDIFGYNFEILPYKRQNAGAHAQIAVKISNPVQSIAYLTGMTAEELNSKAVAGFISESDVVFFGNHAKKD